MTQFTSSAKVIQHFCSNQSDAIDKLAAAVGNRLEKLTQCERYQLATCIGMYLWYVTELTEEEDVEDTLVSFYQTMMPLIATGNVQLCLFLLDGEDPDNLADILPAITEYARNHLMQIEESFDQEEFNGDLIVSGLVPMIGYL